MSVIYVMIGLPGSGKSTEVKKIKLGTVFSSDSTREKLYGDASIQGNPNEVFGRMYHDIHMLLKRDKNAVIVLDATNINRKDRKQICDIGKHYGSQMIAKVMRTPIEACIERNAKRDRVVPVEVIHRMVSRFEYPLYEEGFEIIEDVGYKGQYGDLSIYLELSKDFDQKNIHHSADLYNHMLNASIEIAGRHSYKFAEAGLYHDIGKLFTQTGPDEKGDCHYMGHANWSAYLFFTSDKYMQFNCKLINYHMIPYLHEWEKFRKRFENEPGDFIAMLEILHEADVNAH